MLFDACHNRGDYQAAETYGHSSRSEKYRRSVPETSDEKGEKESSESDADPTARTNVGGANLAIAL